MKNEELEKIIIESSNKSIVSKAWTITKILSIFGWCTGKFIIKNTPTVIGAAWEIKKEISETIADEYYQYKKEQKELEIEEKIKMLTNQGTKT